MIYPIFSIIIITEDDLSNIYTVEEVVHKIGFGVFQILLSFFNLGKAMCF